MKTIIFLILSALLPMVAKADTVKIDGIYYNLHKNTMMAVVTSNPNLYSGEVVIPKSITYYGESYRVAGIEEYAFAGSSSLTSVTILGGVYTIGFNAFYGCGSLTSVTIPDCVTSIGSEAFSYCTNLTEIYCFAENVPKTDDIAFAGTPVASATLHVPTGTVAKYKSAYPWSEFGSIAAMETTPVNSIIADEPPVSVINCYDLFGHRVQHLQSGIYIQNGKKLMHK